MYHFTALVTCLAILFYFLTSASVARARVRYGVKLPAISGHPDFERVFRVQMNTLEWLPIFLPSLWLFAIYVSDRWAGVVGLVWIVGRIVYMVGYTQAVARRSPGFFIQALACIVLLLGSLGMIAWRLVQGW
jgi:glutathione S-transferase